MENVSETQKLNFVRIVDSKSLKEYIVSCEYISTEYMIVDIYSMWISIAWW